MSTALQLFFALLWWVGLATLATCLGVVALVVYGTVVDWWRERQQCKRVRRLMAEVTERAVRR